MTEAKFNGWNRTQLWYIVSENPVRETNMNVLLFSYAGQFVLSSPHNSFFTFHNSSRRSQKGFSGRWCTF